MAVNHAFWRGKRVFLTGHTGFKGGWLSLWLERLGADVTGYALDPPTEPNLFDVAGVSRGMHSIIGDIRIGEDLAKAVREARPEIVFHLAAQPLVRYSYQAPVETYSTNVLGTVHLLEAVRQCRDVRAVVIVTSDKCYDNKEWIWGYRENDPMGGYDPYSSSKGCAELVTSAYRTSYFHPDKYGEHGVAIASGRAGNVIGGGDWAQDRLVPDILRAIAEGHPAVIRNPNAFRPWQHVLEPLSGYMLLAERLAGAGGVDYGGGWNFGPTDEGVRSVQWVTERLTRKWGAGANWRLDNDSLLHEAHHLKLDCSKATALLGWRSTWSVATAIDRIVDWHTALNAGGDVKSYSLQQIAEYEQVVIS